MKILRQIRQIMPPLHAWFLRYTRRNPLQMAEMYSGNFQIEKLSSDEGAIFFGYHDKTPFNQTENKVLAHLVKENEHSLNSECRVIDIGFFQKNGEGKFENYFIKVSMTTTWSWQQGSMLQWNPNYPESQIIFNDLINGNYGAKVFDLEKNTVVKEFNRPIYALSKDGKLSVSINFSRLSRLRPGYGYSLLKDNNSSVSAPSDDGLFIMDMDSGKSKLIVNLYELAVLVPESDNYEHYLNHANFSPDSSLIAFFHIMNNKIDGKRSIRFCLYDLKLKSVSLIEDDRLVSHYDWKGSNTILATNRDSRLKWHYSIYDLLNKTRTDLNSSLTTDGHPMVSPKNDNLVVTDSPPDKRYDQHLLLMDLQTKKSFELDAFYAPYIFRGPLRCDLHPRWDKKGDIICVDTAFMGKREMILLNLSDF